MTRRAAIGLATIAAIYVAFAANATGQRFDDAAKLYAVTNHLHFRGLETLATIVAGVSIAAVIAAQLVWAAAPSTPRDRLATLLWSAVAVVPPWLLAELGKQTIPRHHLHPTPPWIGSASFPSGHVTITTSCLLTTLVLAPPRFRRAVASAATLALMASMTLVITSGMHRPSDVYAAPVLALTWIACMGAGLGAGHATWRAASRRLLALAAALAVVGFALGSVSFRSVASGPQRLPAQTVINQTSHGAVVVALAIALAIGVAAYELLGSFALPPSPLSPVPQE